MTVGIYPDTLIDERLARSPRYFLAPQPCLDMRVPPSVTKCVAFVGIRNPDPIYGGTAFIVSVGGGRIGRSFRYLVTAKHVADEIRGHDAIIRVNTRSGSSVILEGNDIPWWHHPTDKTADVAVVPFFNPPEDVDIAEIPLSMFAMPDDFAKVRLGAGDEIFVTGLFTKSPGDSRNLPIIRTGNLSLAAGEKIRFDKLGLIDAHLVEGRSIGGLSGSPVFIRETLPMRSRIKKTGERRPFLGGGAYYFLGSMVGHWDVPQDMRKAQAEAVNMGISVVVPADKIRDILFMPEMVEMREKIEEKEVRQENGAKLDSGFSAEKAFTKEDFESALKKASRKIEPKNN